MTTKKSKKRRTVNHVSGNQKSDSPIVPNLESAISDISKAIQELASDSGLRASGPTSGRASNTNPEARSLKPEAQPETRAKLAAPANLGATPFGSGFLRVSWNAVAGAKAYLVQYSSDSSFINDTHALMVDAPGTSVTLSDLKADTMYHVKVKRIADTGDTDSDFSMAYLVRTGVAAANETATLLQGWLDELQSVFENASTLVPEVGNTVLTLAERRRLRGSGVRRYGFIDQVSDSALEYPQFWPDYVNQDGEGSLKTIMREIEVLRNLLVFFNSAAREMQDLLLIKGDAAFRLAGTYYMTVRTAARRQVPDAEALFRLLNSFWRRRRSASAEPTQKVTMRNFKALMHGTREGEMFIENESDTVTKGKKKIVDKTRKKQRNSFKEMETGSAEFSDQVAELSSADYEQSEPLAKRYQRLTE